MRSAETTTRRSPATGCCSESREKQVSSIFSRAASIAGVAADDAFGHLGVTLEQRLRGVADGGLDEPADTGEVGEDGVELFVEGLNHGDQPRHPR